MYIFRQENSEFPISHQKTSMNVIHSCANYCQVWGMWYMVNNLFLDTFLLIYSHQDTKGTFQKRFSGFFPLRGYPPPPTPLTENQCEKKKDFFLRGIGGSPPPPLNGKSV